MGLYKEKGIKLGDEPCQSVNESILSYFCHFQENNGNTFEYLISYLK